MSSAAPSQPRWYSWSQDPHGWRGRLASLGFLAAALTLLILFVADAALPVRYGLWILVALAGACVAEWWFGAFGPVLFYDMLRSARRGRFVWLRAAYAGLLLFLLFILFIPHFGRRGGETSVRVEAQLARNFFEAFSVVQFLALTVLTPAYVAGSISEEKDRKTMEFLLATDLRNRELVLSKLGARLANLVLFILVGLPLVSMLQFLGGVEPVLVQGSFAATALTVLGLAGVSILTSTYFKKPRDAVAVAYLVLFAYLALSGLGYAVLQARWPVLTAPVCDAGAFTLGDLLLTALVVTGILAFAWAYWTREGDAAPPLYRLSSAHVVAALLLFALLVSRASFLGLPLLGSFTLGDILLLLIALGGGGIAATAMLSKDARAHVPLTYLVLSAAAGGLALALFLASALSARVGFLGAALWQGGGITVSDLLAAFNSGNLALYFPEIERAGARGDLEVVIPGLLGEYALFHAPLAVICTVWAVVRVRQVALAQMYGKPPERSISARVLGRPPVGRWPVLWKEVFAEGGVRFNWMTWAIVLVLLAGTFVPFVLILIYQSGRPYTGMMRWDGLPFQVNVWVRTATAIVGSLALLAVAVRAATSYSNERDRHTLDSLLTTPLDSTPILLGKWFGAVLTVRMAWLWLALIWALALAVGGLHPMAVPFMILAWFVFASFLATLGLWFSLLSKTSLRATVWTLLTGAAVSFGHWLPWMCCLALPGMAGDISALAKVQSGLTPPAVLAILPFFGEEGDREAVELVGFGLFGVFSYGVATVLLWSGLTLRFRAITGREGFGRPEMGWAPRRPRPVEVDRGPPVVVVEPPRAPPPPSPRRDPPPPIRPQGARLIEEIWDDDPSRRPPPSGR